MLDDVIRRDFSGHMISGGVFQVKLCHLEGFV